MSDAQGKTTANVHAVTLSIPSNPEHMKLVRGLMASAAEVVGFPKPDINCLCLAVDEACTNIIRHAYDGRHDQEIEVRLILGEGRLDVALRDYGKKVPPEEIKPRDLEDIRPGGLGVHFMREIMDEVVYDTSLDVGTELRMTKCLPKG